MYLYANQQGCDGERAYYDGSAMIVMNGEVFGQGKQFSLDDLEVVSATVDLDEVRSYRGSLISRCAQGSQAPHYPRIQIGASLGKRIGATKLKLTKPRQPIYLTAEQEISLGPACWLWDYLRRSKMHGFFLPLSGGIDSASTAIIVSSMCQLVMDRIAANDPLTISDLATITGDDSYRPKDARDLTNKLFHTCYMGTVNSSTQTRDRARSLANEIGSYHMDCDIDNIVSAFLSVFSFVTGKTPSFKAFGGTQAENLALQNVQARTRMVMSYLLAQLLPWCRGETGSLLVLGSANVDECLRGYFTKYDCSSADLNPIGGMSKEDLSLFVEYWYSIKKWPVLSDIISATPTAELEPLGGPEAQNDEADMGMTYKELSMFGRLRKVYRAGPFSMLSRLVEEWPHVAPASVLAKVKKFFYFYSINRHKMVTLPPSYHAENYSPDDNRFDLRPILYNSSWKWQFKQMDELVETLKTLNE